MHGDLLAGLEGPFDLVVSNPPYVEADELEALEPEVREWEPRGALVDDGQTARLVREAGEARSRAGSSSRCTRRGRVRCSEELERAGYARVGITNDLAGKERVVEAWWGTTVERVIDAVRAGLPVLFPTDTVYGLATSADREEYALRLYRLKRRPQASAERPARTRRRDAARVRSGAARQLGSDSARAAARDRTRWCSPIPPAGIRG